MSSKGSLVLARLKQTVGLGQTTQDAEVTEAVDRLNAILAEAAGLRVKLHKLRAAATAVAEARTTVLGGIVQASGLEGAAESGGAPAQRLQEVVGVYAHLDGDLAAAMGTIYDDVVIGEANAWCEYLDALAGDVEAHEQDRLKYDHYADKVKGLREARRARVAKGRIDTEKDVEKLQRNEDKLADAKHAFTTSRKAVLEKLGKAWRQRAARCQRIALRLLQYDTKMVQESQRGLAKLEPVVKSMTAAVKRSFDEAADSPAANWRKDGAATGAAQAATAGAGPGAGSGAAPTATAAPAVSASSGLPPRPRGGTAGDSGAVMSSGRVGEPPSDATTDGDGVVAAEERPSSRLSAGAASDAAARGGVDRSAGGPGNPFLSDDEEPPPVRGRGGSTASGTDAAAPRSSSPSVATNLGTGVRDKAGRFFSWVRRKSTAGGAQVLGGDDDGVSPTASRGQLGGSTGGAFTATGAAPSAAAPPPPPRRASLDAASAAPAASEAAAATAPAPAPAAAPAPAPAPTPAPAPAPAPTPAGSPGSTGRGSRSGRGRRRAASGGPVAVMASPQPAASSGWPVATSPSPAPAAASDSNALQLQAPVEGHGTTRRRRRGSPPPPAAPMPMASTGQWGTFATVGAAPAAPAATTAATTSFGGGTDAWANFGAPAPQPQFATTGAAPVMRPHAASAGAAADAFDPFAGLGIGAPAPAPATTTAGQAPPADNFNPFG